MIDLFLNDEGFSGDARVAEEMGFNAAVVFTYACFRVAENTACEDREHLHEGKYWFEESYGEIAQSIGMGMTDKKVRDALDKLITAGLVSRKKFHASECVHTMSYTVSRDFIVDNYSIGRWITEMEEKEGRKLYMTEEEIDERRRKSLSVSDVW